MIHSHSQSLSHSQSYSLIAQEHEIDPSEVEALSKHFGNDFDSIDHALDGIEQADVGGISDETNYDY